MYNKELKERYIDTKEKQITVDNYFFKNLFKKTEQFEEACEKDVSCFTYYEIINMYKTFSFASVQRLTVFHSALKLYTDWCIEQNLVPDCQNHYTEITVEMRNECINVIKQNKTIVSRSEVLEWCNDLPDANFAFRLLGLFEGLNGKQFSDLINLTLDDIDEKNHTIKLKDRTIKVSTKLIALAHASNEDEKASSLTGKFEREVVYVPSNKVLKDTSLVRNDDAFNQNRRFLTTAGKIYDYLGVDSWMTNTNLIYSGIIDMVNRRATELGISGREYVYSIGQKEIKNQYNKKIVPSVFCNRYADHLI